MAQGVGTLGTVYAVDIQPEMIKLLEREMRRRGGANVKTVLGTITDPKLPPDSLDLALMVDVYHEFEHPYEMLAAIVRALKPGGRLVFVEFRGGDPAVPIKPGAQRSRGSSADVGQNRRRAAVAARHRFPQVVYTPTWVLSSTTRSGGNRI
jgi:SAM-dependent methyltransferase